MHWATQPRCALNLAWLNQNVFKIRELSAFILNREEEVVPQGRAATPSGGELEVCRCEARTPCASGKCSTAIIPQTVAVFGPLVRSELSLQTRTVPGKPCKSLSARACLWVPRWAPSFPLSLPSAGLAYCQGNKAGNS